jgi:L-rhamnose-H+ transport protein
MEFLPLFLVIFASIFQGSFGLGMKFMAPLKWEAWWLVHSVFALIIIPTAWGLIVVPDLFSVLSKASIDAVLMAMTCGALWGIGGILFGKSIPYIGMSLTYGIVMGVCAAAGSLIPFFALENPTDLASFPYIVTGVIVMLVGVAITAYAGILKDKLNTNENRDRKVNFKAGIIIAVLSGLLSAALAIGFDKGGEIGALAISQGAIARNSSLAIWVVVLWGGFIVNAGYSIFLLTKNKTWNSFSVPNAGKAYTWSIVAALLWFGALGVYGQGATLMGDLGAVIGWPILLGLSLIVGNFWAYINKEWNGAKKPFKIMLFGLLVLIIAVVIIGYSNSVS